MRIETIFPAEVDTASVDAAQRKPVSAATSPTVSDRADVGKVSDRAASQVQALVERALAAPEIRQERVQSVKQAIDAGTYQVGAEQLARAILTNPA